jgi:hypothetical protein
MQLPQKTLQGLQETMLRLPLLALLLLSLLLLTLVSTLLLLPVLGC